MLTFQGMSDEYDSLSDIFANLYNSAQMRAPSFRWSK
jgi:hypothetical protein